MKNRVWVTEYVGLSTRLETLAMAFLIQQRWGHEVCLDWHELDAFTVDGTRRRKRGLLARLDSAKLRSYQPEAFERAGRHRNIVLRTHEGPRPELEPLYLPTARRIRLRSDLVDTIRATFARHAGRPVVGVHVRRGDFPLVSTQRFDVNATAWPAVPDWWFAHVMGAIRAAVPDVAFYVACTGRLADYTWLEGFEVFDVPVPYVYDYKGPDHASARHPVSDLYALACCPLIVGTPCSTFTHYAADMLGEPSTVLVPPSTPITRDAPDFRCLDLWGHGAHDYYAACRTGRDLRVVDDVRGLPIRRGARTDWIPVA